jgi:hypothetical protein
MQTLLFLDRRFWEPQANATHGQGDIVAGIGGLLFPGIGTPGYKKADACGPPIS